MNVIIENLASTVSVEMPRTRRIDSSGTYESKSVKVSGGKIKEEMIGFRPSLIMSWDWVPDETIKGLCALLRTGTLFRVKYPDVDGEGERIFKVSYPKPTIFAFRGGVPVWHDVRLSMTAQEVER